MRIGLTYDLKEEYLHRGFDDESAAEFDSPETIHAIVDVLTGLGHEVDCIGGIRALTSRLASGDRWDLVFNIAEGWQGVGREAQVPSLLDAFDIPYTFSDPLVLALTLHKGVCKSLVRAMGVPTADFAVVERLADVDALPIRFPVFAKPVAEGSSKGIDAHSRCDSRETLRAVCGDLLERFRQPILVEEYLAGREFTVGILGTGADADAVGVLEVLLRDNAESPGYSYANKQEYQSRVTYRLAADDAGIAARDIALTVWRGLGCRDGGRVDLRCSASGAPQFLEVNPLPGLHPQHSDLVILGRLCGVSHRDLIAAIVRSALGRIEAGQDLAESSSIEGR